MIDLNLAELKEFSEHLEADVFDVLSVEGSVNSRVSTGGTALVRVTEALEQAEIYLG